MRVNGIFEVEIIGLVFNFEKFKVFVRILERVYGNFVYYWFVMELKNVFGVNEILIELNVEEIYYCLNYFLKEYKISFRCLIVDSKVMFIGIIDYFFDIFKWYKKLVVDESFKIVVVLIFRLDEVFIEYWYFVDFIIKLGDII